MRYFNKNINLYTFIQRARRVGLRAMGVFVARFASSRADALDENAILQRACPGCGRTLYSICDSNGGIELYDDFVAFGTEYMRCIPADNRGSGHSPAFVDNACMEKLMKIGMCSGVYNYDTALLYNPSLNCVNHINTGISLGGQYNAYPYGYINYETNGRSYGAWREFGAQNAPSGATNYLYMCCNTSGIDVTSGSSSIDCYFYSDSCIALASCGIYSPMIRGMASVYPLGGVTDINKYACSLEFQEYFRSQLSTGWCDSQSNIYVEGIGAILINQYCYGEDFIGDNLYNQFCGVIIEGCNNFCGYYLNTTAERDPYMFSQYGSEYYCKQCPSATYNDLGFSGVGTVVSYQRGDNHGKESCYLEVLKNPYTYTDDTGTVEVNFSSNTCTYTE